MPLLATDAIVLHAFDYSDSSRILRLATRDAGVQSVLARGARRPKSRFGTALDIFAEGIAQLYLKEGRDLQTLGAFDVVRSRAMVASDLGRFASASALAELMLRFATDDASSALYDTFAGALDAIEGADPLDAREAGLAGAWRVVAALGFAPALEVCGSCHAAIVPSETLRFSHEAGGVLCRSCEGLYPTGRALPPSARARVSAWLDTESVTRPSVTARLPEPEARAHQRLLREFLQHHLVEGRALRAFEAWECGGWSAP
jgi:DNA repair protein RecO (recombination protein O)